MTKDEAIIEACAIISLAFHSLQDYKYANDGFCSKCDIPNSSYMNDGRMLRYVRLAVVQRLKREGIKIADGFNKRTGKELK